MYAHLFCPDREAMLRGEPWQQLELVVPVTADRPRLRGIAARRDPDPTGAGVRRVTGSG